MCVGLNGEEEGRVQKPIYRSNAFFSKLVDAFERKQCVCVAGTAGLSAPEVCENALLGKTVSQELFQSSEQSGATQALLLLTAFVSLNVCLH